MLHVHLDSERAYTLIIETHPHLAELVKVLFHRGVSPRRINHLLSAPRHLFRILEAHISLAFLDQLNGQIMQVIKVVR